MSPSQPAMSRQIQLLEAEMGARLLERSSRGVSLTPIGALVYRQAESILADMSRTRIEVDLAINRPAGQISLAAPTFFVRAFMPEVMLRFHQTYPEVGLRVVESSTGHVSEMMAAGEVDLAVVLQAPNSARVKTEALISEHMDLCVSTTHEWATRTHATRSELDGRSCCLAANPHGSRMLIERWCQNGGIRLDVKLEMDSFFLMKLAIRTLPIFSFIPSGDIEPGDASDLDPAGPADRTDPIPGLPARSQASAGGAADARDPQRAEGPSGAPGHAPALQDPTNSQGQFQMTEPSRRACIVGIGQSEFTRWGGIMNRSQFQVTAEAIATALKDAGLRGPDVDGFASFSNDQNEGPLMAVALGSRDLRWSSMVWGGGGGGTCGSISQACAALESGQASVVVAYRGLCQGQFRRFGKFGQGRLHGNFVHPFGLMAPAQMLAMVMRRFMHEHPGVGHEHMAEIALNARANANRNPLAVMHDKPLTREQYFASRWIAEPFRLYDCCLETDGACAVVLTTRERARDLGQPVIEVLASAHGGGAGWGSGPLGSHNMPADTYASTNSRPANCSIVRA